MLCVLLQFYMNFIYSGGIVYRYIFCNTTDFDICMFILGVCCLSYVMYMWFFLFSLLQYISVV